MLIDINFLHPHHTLLGLILLLTYSFWNIFSFNSNITFQSITAVMQKSKKWLIIISIISVILTWF